MDSATAPKVTKKRNSRKATCSSCRHRKSKCDGRYPQCSTCKTYKSQCRYDKPPSLTYVRSLEAKVQHLESELAATNPAEAAADTPWSKNDVSQSPSPPHEETESPSNHTVVGSHGSRGDTDHWVSEISIDSQGGVCYHNPTSAIHEAPENEQLSNHSTSFVTYSPESFSMVATDSDHIKEALVSNAATQRLFEGVVVENMEHSDVSKTMAGELLMLHWCWMHPMFMTVYRPAFMRDMAIATTSHQQTQYFSHTLLKVIFAHSSRFFVKSAHEQSSHNTFMSTLTDQALLSLGMGITSQSSIPIIQALIQQAGREIAFGKSSQAWLYSGMAFRMAIDLGIHLPVDRLRAYVKSLTAEDVEIRKRLFWSCYTFDKAISLYLGRMPAFVPPLDSHNPDFMDDFTEHDLWEPFYGSTARDPARTTDHYPPTKGHVVSCFTALCKLSVILSMTMLDIYGSSSGMNEIHFNTVNSASTAKAHQSHLEPRSPKTPAFTRISSQLQNWLSSLPVHLRLNVQALPNLSPPPHIVSLNLLYHTTVILLHRPFILDPASFGNPAVSRSYHICTVAAAAIHDLLDLLTTTFGCSHITYLNSYSAYIAATIAVLHFGREEGASDPSALTIPEGKLGLKFFLEILQKTATSMPALARSVEIIKRHMQVILDRRSKRYLDSLFTSAGRGKYTINDQRNRSYVGNSSSNQASTLQIRRSSADGSLSPPDIMCSTVNLAGLPAFPGQNLNMGLQYAFSAEITDPEARAALMGLNLDPHLTLHHDNEGWDFDGGFCGESGQ